MNIESFKLCEEDMDEKSMVYARRVGAYGTQNTILMELFKEWILKNGYMNTESVILGIARDDVRITKPELCRYDVCLLGEDIKNLPDWIYEGKMESGKYVVIELPHTAEAVGIVWQEGVDYLLKLGYQLDFGRAIIERYKKVLVEQHICEMMFPIKTEN